MSLAGIAISIGILVDQAIVMVENATHHLTAHFGGGRVRGDTRELVIPACRTVGRPIFFSVIIILLSFLPVFALTGQEGKTFHPLAFTKSFAMIGVAILSITLVPALIPTFIRGRLRSEEESWLVRTLIHIYKPVLSWALNYPKVINWFFVVLLALGWHLWGKLGSEYMPALDEGSILDMPVTVPRASVAETADAIKARDALLRRFPEVELVVGKAGRAETPTDPSPLEMLETIITLRPKELWPKRHLKYADAQSQVAVVLGKLIDEKLVKAPADAAGRDALLNAATMTAASRLDAALRDFVLVRYGQFEARLAPRLVREFAAELVARWRGAGRLLRQVGGQETDALAGQLAAEFGPVLAAGAAQEDVNRLIQQIAQRLSTAKAVKLDPELLALPAGPLREAWLQIGNVLGTQRPTLFTEMLAFIRQRQRTLWQEQVRPLNYEIFDRAAGAYDWHCLDSLREEAKERGLWIGVQPGASDEAALRRLRGQLDGPFAGGLLLWQLTKPALVQEIDTVVRVPGWANIWTQPIINRIDMLATGVRTMVGVKVFGDNLEKIQAVAEAVEAVVGQVPGAADVTVDQSRNKGYLDIVIDRKRAARYGVSVGDIQDVIEVALGGKAITMTVEGRERFPVRIRYARHWREDEEQVKNLLVSAGGRMAPAGGMDNAGAGGMAPAAPISGIAPTRPVQIPLSMVADVRIVEGPSMINSENGTLMSKVQLNVRDRDLMGFVDEAQRAVAQKVKLPQGMSLQWSGQFEHQLHARRTLQVVVPLVVVLIFVILYLTYNDWMDALLMMMAVPEAMVGGFFILWLRGDNLSVAVWVGFIACFGMATETGIIMLVYLREAIERRGGLEKIASLAELRQAVIDGAVHRLRPKLLTEGVAIIALAPMLWASGVGHEVISVMAAPVLGGLLVSDEVVDIFLPVRFYWVRRSRWLKLHTTSVPEES